MRIAGLWRVAEYAGYVGPGNGGCNFGRQALERLNMKNRFVVIYGTRPDRPAQDRLQPFKRRTREEPNIEVLNESPCLKCEMYVEDTTCHHARQGCSKIDEFQRVAAVHCTLFKDQDIFSILKI